MKKNIIRNLKVVKRQLQKSDKVLKGEENNHVWHDEIIWIDEAIRFLEELEGKNKK